MPPHHLALPPRRALQSLVMVWKLVLAFLLAISLVAWGGYEGVTCLDWSPDGTLLLFTHSGMLFLATAPEGRDPRPLDHTEGVDWGRFHPSGEWIVYASPVEGGYALWRHPLQEEAEREQLHFSSLPLAQPAVAPDGERIAFLSLPDRYWTLYLLDLESGEVDELTKHPWHASAPDFSPDGSEVAFVGLSGESWDLFILNIERDLLEQLTTDARLYWTPRFAPSGDWIALETLQEGQSDIYVIRRDGSELTPLTNDRWRNAFPVWSSDGDTIVYASNRVGGWVFIAEDTY